METGDTEKRVRKVRKEKYDGNHEPTTTDDNDFKRKTTTKNIPQNSKLTHPCTKLSLRPSFGALALFSPGFSSPLMVLLRVVMSSFVITLSYFCLLSASRSLSTSSTSDMSESESSLFESTQAENKTGT